MPKLRDYPPVRDVATVAQADWECGPVGQTADSDARVRSNFDALCDWLDEEDPHGTTWDIIRFPHWDTEWLDLVFVAPGSPSDGLASMAAEHLLTHLALDVGLWQEYDREDKDGTADSVECPVDEFDPINDGGHG